MNRDALLATLIGLGLGLLMTGALIVGPGLLKFIPHINFTFFNVSRTTVPGSPTPTPTPSVFSVTIESPLPDSISETNTLVISGTTFANSIVVMQGPTDEDVVTAANNGKYAGKITLVEGRNDISVTSYIKDKQSSQMVTVFYTKENL